MSPTEIYVRQPSQWNVALITLGVLVAAYLYYGHLPIIFLLAGVVVVARLLTIAIRGEAKVDPVIILNDEGVFDKRLKVGDIDVLRASSWWPLHLLMTLGALLVTLSVTQRRRSPVQMTTLRATPAHRV